MTQDIVDSVPRSFLALQVDEHVFSSPTLRGELYSGPPETLEARTAIGALTKLVHAADRAKENSSLALSWRNYNVGSSAIMCNFETGQMGFFSGFNVKPDQGQSSLNLHAEQVAIAKGRAQGLNRVIGISVFADPTDDDANPDNNATLRPCNRCVQMFVDIPEVTDNTLVLGTNEDLSVCELYTAGSLVQPEMPKLVPGHFALQSEHDLEYYDREIQPQLILPILSLYGN
jgi:cytidine deaminase